MGLKELYLKFKSKQLLIKGSTITNERSTAVDASRKASWMTPVSHGYHVVGGGADQYSSPSVYLDTVLVQREEITPSLEVWLYGISDATTTATEIARYMQNNLFDKKPRESQIRKKGKETLRRAYVNAKAAKLKENAKSEDDELIIDSASLMVINGKRLVLANMGDCRAIICKDGVAYQPGTKNQQTGRRRWPQRLISGALRMPKLRNQASNSGGGETSTRHRRGARLVVATERVDSDIEFIILAGRGVWEVMSNAEAVGLIRHIDDPQAAAECLAREASARFSRSNISCLVVRFD